MKITDVEAFYVRLPEVKEQCDSGQDVLVVRVHTDEGITGIGEVDSAPLAAQSVILGPYSHTITSGLKHLVIGEDPFETEYLWDKMYRQNIYAGRFGVAIHAMSGIDIAPTILETLSVPIPAQMQGQELLTRIAGERTGPAPPAFSETFLKGGASGARAITALSAI